MQITQILPASDFETPLSSDLIALLCGGRSLSADQSRSLFGALVDGQLSEAEIAALLVALKVKGESVEELIGAARALRSAALPFDRPDYLFADSCGTGGDGSHTINLSTAVAFVAAAAGLPIAQHGNRSITSRCGSADVLELLGVKIETSPEASRRALDQVGICFLFAPQYHPGLRHAGPVRRALKVRTVMNLLGPCVNPASPGVQLLGVADPDLLEPIAATLMGVGTTRALVVHGSGMDEVALHGETQAIQIGGGTMRRLTFNPEQAGVERIALRKLQAGSPAENGERLTALLRGRGRSADRDAVAINSAALFLAAGMAETLRDGVALAHSTLATGEPFRRLQALAEISRHG